MADDTQQDLDARGRELARTSQEMQQNFSEIRSMLTDVNRILGRSADGAIEFKKAMNGVETATSNLNKLQNEYTESSKGTKKVQNELTKSQSNASKLQAASQVALRKAADARGRGESYIARQYDRQAENLQIAAEEAQGLVGVLGEMAAEAEHLDKNTKFFGQMANVVKSIPGLKGFSEPFARAEKSARNILANGGSSGEAFRAGASEFGKELDKFAKAAFIKGFFDISSNSANLAKQLNISTVESLKLERSFRNQALQSGKLNLNTKQFAEANSQLNKSLGTSEIFSAKTLQNFTILTKRFGQTNETAAKLAKLASITGQDYTEQTKSLIGQVEVSNALSGINIDNKKVLEDVGSLNTATLLTLRNQGVQLGKAAADVRRLGLNFQLLESSSSALLNFETSISDELEAELLTGKELTLERARIAALTGDTVTLAAELARNFGTAEEFTSQNVLAQQAQAKALGMTREELANVLMEREALLQMGVRDNAEAKQKINDLIREKGFRAAIAEYGDSQYARQLANQSIQEKFNDTMIRLKGVIVSLVDGPMGGLLTLLEKTLNTVNYIGSAFGKLGSAGDYIYGAIVKIASAGTAIAKPFKGIIVGAEMMIQTMGKLGTAIKTAFNGFKTFGKGLGKLFGVGLLKKIPGIGLILSTLTAIGRAMNGDWIGAAMDIGSGIASLFPGIGTGISIGIDAASVARDKYRSNKEEKGTTTSANTTNNPDNQTVKANDFTIRTHPKDTLMMAGGTKLGDAGEKTNMLLEKLIAAVEKGGDVYIDGNKAGKALALATYRSS